MKLTGTLPRLPGAPKRNKNAAGSRKKKSTLTADSAVANISAEAATESPEQSGSEQEIRLSKDAPSGTEAESFAQTESGNEENVATAIMPDTATFQPGESIDNSIADRPPNLPVAKRDYDENTFRQLIEGLAGEKSKSDEGKALLEEEDFDELLMNVDRLGTQAESGDAEEKKADGVTVDRSDEQDASSGSRIPNSGRADEQLSLFNF